MIDQGAQLVHHDGSPLRTVVSDAPVFHLECCFDGRSGVGQADLGHDGVGTGLGSLGELLDRRAVQQVGLGPARGRGDLYAETAGFAVRPLEVGPHNEMVAPGIDQRHSTQRRHAAQFLGPGRHGSALVGQPPQQTTGPAAVPAGSVGGDRGRDRRRGCGVVAVLRRGQHSRRAQRVAAGETTGMEQRLYGRRPNLGLVQVSVASSRRGGALQQQLLRGWAFAWQLAAAFGGPGSLRGYASAAAAALWS